MYFLLSKAVAFTTCQCNNAFQTLRKTVLDIAYILHIYITYILHIYCIQPKPRSLDLTPNEFFSARTNFLLSLLGKSAVARFDQNICFLLLALCSCIQHPQVLKRPFLFSPQPGKYQGLPADLLVKLGLWQETPRGDERNLSLVLCRQFGRHCNDIPQGEMKEATCLHLSETASKIQIEQQ